MGNTQTAPDPQLLGFHQISPSLKLHVTPEEVITPKGKVGCYAIVSKGLPQNHPEIVFSIRRNSKLEFQTIVNLYTALEKAANQGSTVQPGGLTTFVSPLFGYFHGILYAQAISIGDHYFPDNYLMGFFITKEELALVNQFGGIHLLMISIVLRWVK
jgi:hypothetical protein